MEHLILAPGDERAKGHLRQPRAGREVDCPFRAGNEGWRGTNCYQNLHFDDFSLTPRGTLWEKEMQPPVNPQPGYSQFGEYGEEWVHERSSLTRRITSPTSKGSSPPMRQSWDAVIVGAGPAGSTLAMLLARWGWQVAIVDAAVFPRQKVCGEFLSPAIWPLLRLLDLDHEVRHEALALQSVRLTLAGGRMAEASLAGREDLQPAALSRYRLDHLLLEHARASGAHVELGYRVRRVLIDEGRAVGLEASAVERASHTLEFRAPVIIAADGRRSIVVQQTGRTTACRGDLVGFKRHFAAPTSNGGMSAAGDASTDDLALDMHCLQGGYAGLCTVEGGAINLCGVMPRKRLLAARGSIETALCTWAAAHPRIVNLIQGNSALDVWHTMPEVSQQAAFPTMDGVLYVGDACGTIEPLTGQGMTMAIAGAILAADFLSAHAGRPLNAELQTEYLTQWRNQFAASIRHTAWLGHLLRHPRLLDVLWPLQRFWPTLGTAILRTGYQATLVRPDIQSALQRKAMNDQAKQVPHDDRLVV
jgi:flavin-dependent dehydrogenase